MSFSSNLLVVSDLHLGEDLSPSATEANRLHTDMVERQLCNFLRHYSRRRDDGRPWRLIVNGDLVDFMSVTIGPEHPAFAELGADATEEERRFGLRRTRAVAREKLALVFARHDEVFRAMARFLARGHQIDLVCGNHDAELAWPELQGDFRARLAAIWQGLPEARRAGAPGGDELAARVAFHPWFFYEKDVLWVEHGHQYDECCSFEHQLEPATSDGEIVMNVDTAGARFITNYVREASPHEHDDWTALGYLQFGASLGLRGGLRLCRAYYLFTTRLFQTWRRRRADRKGRAAARVAHLERRRALAREWDVSDELLGRVEAVRRRPAVESFARLAPILMVDKLFIYGAALVAGLAALFALGLPFGALIAAASLVLAHFATAWTGRGRAVDPSRILCRASENIQRTVGAKYVVFGHTHEPVAQPAGDGTYFNLGTWIPSGRPGILRSFTHLVVRARPGGVEASLCQWRDGQSRAFTPGWQPVHEPKRRALTAPATATEPVRVRVTP